MNGSTTGGPASREMNFSELYLGIQGRISRSTYWLRGVLPILGISIVAGILDAGGGGGVFQGIWGILSLWPGIALMVKRLHDRDKSGWWGLLILIPLIGFIWWLVDVGILEGTQGQNRFGPDPVDRGDAVRGIAVRDDADIGRRG